MVASLFYKRGDSAVEAAIKIAVDMVAEGMIDETEALLRIEAGLANICCTRRSTRVRMNVLTKGLPASPVRRAANCLSADRAEALAAQGKGCGVGAHGNQPGRHSRHVSGARHF